MLSVLRLGCSAIHSFPSLRSFIRTQKMARLSATAGVLFAVMCGPWINASAQSLTATTTTLAVTSGGSAVTTVASGTVVTLTASVKAGATDLTVGRVNFCDAAATYCTDIHLLGTAQLTSARTAAIKFRPGIGSHSYKALFVGTTSDAGSSSGIATLRVTGTPIQTSTTTTLAKSGSWGNYGLSATVTETGALASPTGTISFLDTGNGNAVLGTAALGAGNPGLTWLNPQTLAGFNPEAIAVGDFNGDGIPDLAEISGAQNFVTIYLGNGDGTFTQLTSVTPPATGSSPSSIAVGDFNGDGKLDLAVVNDESDTVSILLGNGDGSFTATAASPATGVAPVNIAVADFNGDGIPDLVVSTPFTDTINIFLGNGDGTFTPAAVTTTASGPGNTVAVGDFNGDGKPDLAIGSNSAVYILLGNGDGTFTAAPTQTTTGYFSSIVIGDFNGDGKLDMAVGNLQNVTGESTAVEIYLGNGDGTFNALPSLLPVGAPAENMAIGDFNQDGIPDLAIPTYSGAITMMLGNGDGTFTASPSSPVAGANAGPSAVSDFNGDGRPDVAVISHFNYNVVVFVTEPTETATTAPTAIEPSAVGNHLVDASYPGDSNYTSSVSATTSLWGAVPATTTTLAITSGGIPATTVAAGSAVTLTASVKVGASIFTSGQVNFCDATATACNDIHLIGSASLTSNGTAFIKIVPGPGQHSYKAVLLESGYGMSSSSPAETLTVSAPPHVTAPTTTTIAASGNASDYTLTATVSGTGSTSPLTGNVSFLDTSYANSVLATAPVGASTPGLTWLTPSSTSIASSTFPSLAVADFNGDGIPDIAVVNEYSTTLTILLGNGDGTFTTGAALIVPGNPKQIVAGDFNRDGKVDLAVASEIFSGTQEAPGTISVFLGNGDGTFTATATSPQMGRAPESLLMADFNGDGKLDLLGISFYDNATVLLGNGDGTFTPVANSGVSPSQPYSGTVGDFNGDGIPDLAEANNLGSPLSIFLGNGDGTFTETTSPYIGPSPYIGLWSTFVTTGDFNGDGKLDLAATNNGGSVTILLGNGDGTFTLAANNPITVGSNPLSIAVADLNQDGIPDLAVANYYGSTVSVLLGNGDGTFTVAANGPEANYPSTIIAADFSGNGIPSLAVGTADGVSVLLTEPTETATATATGVAPTGPSPHLVDASYPGDSNYGASASTTTPLSVQVATPVITPATGTYTTIQTVNITDTTPGATIYYSANGNGQFIPYTGSFTASSTYQAVQAYASETGYITSSVANSYITLNLPTPAPPVISLASGSYPSAQTLTITDATPGAVIYYTTNGSLPNSSSTQYTGQITVSSSEVVAAVAAYGYATSTPVTAQYLIGTSSTRFIYAYAGDGSFGYSGDNGPATAADMGDPEGTVLDSAGNLYIADVFNHVVRKVTAGTGVITTVAGNGTAGYSGDNGAATSAELSAPEFLAFDSAGNLYISDPSDNVVRKVAAATGIITTVAGNGTSGFSGDTGAATSAELNYPQGVAIDNAGNLYIADTFNLRVRKVAAGTGIISTYAGSGALGYTGDGGLASSAALGQIYGLSVDSAGNLYIADVEFAVVREVDAASLVISTFAGTGKAGYAGDGGAATAAMLSGPRGLTFDSGGDLYIADTSNGVIRMVTAGGGIISTIAGNGSPCYLLAGDGSPAASAMLCSPVGVSVNAVGDVFISDTALNRIRLVTTPSAPPSNATPQPIFNVSQGTYATTQTVNITDSAPGAAIYLTFDGTTPTTLSPIYNGPISASGSLTIKAIALAPGYLPSAPLTAAYTITAPPAAIITTVAGNGLYGFSGNGGPAISAEIAIYPSIEYYSQGFAFDPAGNLYFTDAGNNVVWMVSAATGDISIVAGTGASGYSGDGGPATSALISSPSGLAADSAGNLYISDPWNNVVRKVTASSGVISTYAGDGHYGQYGYPYQYGDGGPATSAGLYQPTGLAVDRAGNLYIVDTQHEKVREVSALTGIITTVAGDGIPGDSGDGQLAINAAMDEPSTIALDGAGNVYIGEVFSGRVRKVTVSTGVITTIAGNESVAGNSGDGGPATDAAIAPTGIAIDGSGSIYIASLPDEVREVSAATGIITKVAGNGYQVYSGDGGAATVAGLNEPVGMAIDKAGSIYFADTSSSRIRKVAYTNPATAPALSVQTGTFTTVQTVSITDGMQGATIYYTTDGSTPTTASNVYSNPITVSTTVTLQAIAVVTGYSTSAITSATYTINLPPAAPITWAAPAAITYGTALSAAQLDATSTVSGGFAYTPGAGTVLPAGAQTLSATFTPTDTTDYSSATATVNLTVNQATPAITWSTPAAITYGAALSATQLDASSTVAGSFAYSAAVETVLGAGSHTLTAIFTPADTADYKGGTASVTLVVNEATPSIAWSTPAAITYGTALSAVQLNAGSSLPGSFAYTPPAGTVLGAGKQTLSVTFTPTDATDYQTTTDAVILTVNKATPVITVMPSSSSITSAQPLSVTVAISAGIPNPVPTGSVVLTSGSYQSAATTLSNGAATIGIAGGSLGLGSDTLTVTYTPDASSTGNYTTATQSATVTVTTAIGTAASTVTVMPSATTITNEQKVSVTITVTGGSGQATPTGSVTLASGSFSAQQTLSSGAASFDIAAGTLSSGANTLTASYAGDANYATSSGTATIMVVDVTLTIPAPTPVSPGGTATAIATLNAGSHYSGTMNLLCSLAASPTGAVNLPTCSLNPGSAILAAGGNASTTLTINTTAASSSALALPLRQNLWGLSGGGALLAVVLIFWVPSGRRRLITMLILLSVAAAGCAIGCGGDGGGGGGGRQTTGSSTPATTAGNYTFTVTGTDSVNAKITASANVTITVQ
jgi:hypothetical protein